MLNDPVPLDLEGSDRLYLTTRINRDCRPAGGSLATFFKVDRGDKAAANVLMAPINYAFVNAIEGFTQREHLEIATFAKGQRKDDATKE